MSELSPEHEIEIQKLNVQMAAVMANMQRSRLELLQLEQRRQEALQNIASSEAAIAHCEEKIKHLRETHTQKPEDD